MGMFSSFTGGGGSAKRAAAVQAEAQKKAGKLMMDTARETAGYFDPYAQAGKGALDQYVSALPGLSSFVNQMYGPGNEIYKGIDFNNYEQSPGYQFRLGQGQRTLENSAAARGGVLSGRTAKALTEYGQNFATADYDNYLRRQHEAINTGINTRNAGLNAQLMPISQYANLAGIGLGAADTKSGILNAGAATQGGYITGAANATAEGMMAKAAQLQASGNQWMKIGATAAGGIAGGMGMLGGAHGIEGALNGANIGNQFGGGSGFRYVR